MIKNISVIGAGTMGHGIAEVFALSGYKVSLYEYSDDIRNNAKRIIEDELVFMAENDFISKEDINKTLDNILLFSDLKDSVISADYVIEAIPEQISLKQDLFKNLDEYCPSHTILATNTSSLSFDEIIKFISEDRKALSMVCHWYNPAHLMPIAELSFFGNMSESIYKEVEDLYIKAGKQTVKILKDIPGLVANRIQQAIAREVFSLIEMGVATPEDIDKALKFGPAFRYATSGQLEIADIGGLDIWCVVGDNLLSVMDNRKDANPLLRQKVAEHKLGMKTGEGFFEYPKEKINEIKNKFNKKLLVQLKTSKSYIE